MGLRALSLPKGRLCSLTYRTPEQLEKVGRHTLSFRGLRLFLSNFFKIASFVLCALLLALFFTKEAAWHAVLRFLIFGLLKTALDIFCPPYPGSTQIGFHSIYRPLC